MKSIAVTGSSGFVGKEIDIYFSKIGYKIIPISRSVLKDKDCLQNIVDKADIVINLAGATIIKRWTKSYKNVLYNSRVDTTKKVVEAIKNSKTPPSLFISTSAIGIYDNIGTHDERGSIGKGFLSRLAKHWEEEALKAESDDIKVSIFRLSVVLGKSGGALKRMLPPFKMGLGGVIGSGKQPFSFIHIEDLMEGYRFVIENKYNGIFNLSSPHPCTNMDLTKSLGKHLKRFTIFTVPEFVLKLIFGEGSKVLTEGQIAIPKRLEDLNFNFKYRTIDEAIENIVGDN
ncbi:MAG: TIGR01777 family protein [Candidatus Cloacimonadota bacterium]|nr:MAG: TIGR01777 family protein [Candidatus Cloacimonadota bacterium]PIE78560.1 MAG: TIGR01777 family protein [Candidatus Delongbacteria bacterium]